MKKTNEVDNDQLIGTIYAVGAFFVWGLLPLYWKLLNQIPADQILAHRIIWSFVFVFSILFFQKRLSSFKQVVSDSQKLIPLLFSTIFISINWYLFIWAINNNHVVESSMGYYINPLIVILLGMIVLKEKLNFWQIISLTLASIGVIIMTLQYGKVPWIALSLAISFAIYGLFKKVVKVESIIGLGLETLIVMPIALVYLVTKQINGTGVLGSISLTTTLILICSGIATATPLIWFARGASKVPLSTIGFAQYIAPTINLFIGVFVFKEQFTTTHFISFGFIWLGLILYSLSQMNILKDIQPKFLKEIKNQ